MNVGIIGGADGPTSIFIASPLFWPMAVGVTLTIAFVIIAIMAKKR